MPAVRSSQRPLGLKAAFKVSDKVLETLRFIEAFDLEGDEETKRSAKPLGPRGATLEFKRFLALPLLYPKEASQFVPSLPLDALWHAFILNTQLYRHFCDKVYGEYLDHIPGKSRKETKRTINQGAMKLTVDSIAGAFENVNRRYWGRIVFCGPCLIFTPQRSPAWSRRLRS
jgi:hypothetical protein